MSPIRRLYLYTVATLSLVVLLIASVICGRELASLLLAGRAPFASEDAHSALLGAALAQLARGAAGVWLGLGVVALLLWAVHWFLADRPARPLTLAGAAERRSPVRKAYLYLGQGASLLALLTQVAPLLNALLRVLTGQGTATLDGWPARQAGMAVGAAIALLFWLGLRRTALRDGDFGLESGRAASIRRTYYALVIFAGSVLAAVGAAELVRAILRLGGQVLAFDKPAGVSWRTELVVPLTALVIGPAAGADRPGPRDRLALSGPAPSQELNAFSRVTLVYGAILAGTGATLLSLGYLLWQGLLICCLLGGDRGCAAGPLGRPACGAVGLPAGWHRRLDPGGPRRPGGRDPRG